jgi:hypothetical protein
MLYLAITEKGKASYINLMYSDHYMDENIIAAIRGVTLNKPVPLKIFWPRKLLFSIAAFCIVVIKRKKLFSLPLKCYSIRQNILTAGIMLVFIVYLFVLMLLAAPFSTKRPFKENFSNARDQYNAEIVDAILNGHAYFNFELSDEFLALKNPYDVGERSSANVDYHWDTLYYI